MSIHIYEDMEQNESATSKSGSEKISPTSTAFSSQSPSPGLTNSHHNGGVTIGDVNFPIPGWPKLARTIADKTAFAAFPSFTDLNVKSILYYQAALIRLRKELHKTEVQDYFHGDNTQGHFAEDLDWLLDSENTDPEKNPEQFKILEKIRVILDKYSKPLPERLRKKNIQLTWLFSKIMHLSSSHRFLHSQRLTVPMSSP